MTGENSLLKYLLINGDEEIKAILDSLIRNETVNEFIDFTMNYSSAAFDRKTILSILVASSYLTVENKIDFGLYSLRIPNKEIQSIFVNEVLSLIPDQGLLKNAILLRKAFANGDLSSIEQMLESLFLSSFSYYDFSDEKNYQILLLTISSILFEDAVVKSEVIVGTGRCYIQIISKKNDFGFIIEVKSYKGNISGSRLTEYSKKALQQILDKDYGEEVMQRGNKNIVEYGIAFSNKHVKISQKRFKRLFNI